jgi:hypothetical protein
LILNPRRPTVAHNTPQYLKPLEAAKAYVALVGAIATGLLGVYAADTVVGQVLTVIVIVATAIAVFRVPNAEAEHVDDGEFGDDVYLDGHEGS